MPLNGTRFRNSQTQQSRRGMGADGLASSPQNGAVVATASVGSFQVQADYFELA